MHFFIIAFQMMDVPHMAYMQAGTSIESTGSLSGNFAFKLAHPVNISSRDTSHLQRKRQPPQPQPPAHFPLEQQSDFRVLLDQTPLPSVLVYSYASPEIQPGAVLRATGLYPKQQQDGRQVSPLLASNTARVFVDGAYVGQTRVTETQPGSTFRLSLGDDKLMQVSRVQNIQKDSGEEHDKSTWFTVDKKRYQVKSEHAVVEARNSHPGPQPFLAIIAESVPLSTNEGIRVELDEPSSKSLIALQLSVSTASEPTAGTPSETRAGKRPSRSRAAGAEMTNEAFLDAVVAYMENVRGGATPSAFRNPASGVIYFAQWLLPGAVLRAPISYRVIWPEEKSIAIY
jgi:hypothetical protein